MRASCPLRAPVDAVKGHLTCKKTHPLGPYRSPMYRDLGGSFGVGVFLWARYPCTSDIRGYKCCKNVQEL